jgi:hypothetical protein
MAQDLASMSASISACRHRGRWSAKGAATAKALGRRQRSLGVLRGRKLPFRYRPDHAIKREPRRLALSSAREAGADIQAPRLLQPLSAQSGLYPYPQLQLTADLSERPAAPPTPLASHACGRIERVLATDRRRSGPPGDVRFGEASSMTRMTPVGAKRPIQPSRSIWLLRAQNRTMAGLP